MTDKKLDPETQKVFSDGEKLKSMTESSGWPIAKARLNAKVADLLNIMSIENPDPKFIIQIIGIRQETAKALMAWMAEIEGTVEQHKANTGAYMNTENDFILHLEP